MSKIGKKPVKLPENVEVNISDGGVVVKGPRGELSIDKPKEIKVEIKDGEIFFENKGNKKSGKEMHGTIRALVSNMVKGVTEGWEKKLELVGTGYRAEVSGKKLIITIGYSHPVEMEAPEGIEINADKTNITISGIDKEKVGEFAAKVRSIRKPEPYKGKGIKYIDEVVRRKPGKAAKAAGAA